jgi:hypothetical protein
VAQAPIDRLLAGAGGASFDLAVRGDADRVRRRLLDLPWVDGVADRVLDGIVDLRVQVADERRAERDLLRAVLADDTTEVVRFGATRTELEDVFVELVETGGRP